MVVAVVPSSFIDAMLWRFASPTLGFCYLA